MTKRNSSSKRKTNIEMQEEKEIKILEEKKVKNPSNIITRKKEWTHNDTYKSERQKKEAMKKKKRRRKEHNVLDQTIVQN